jgi:hypothetical protein
VLGLVEGVVAKCIVEDRGQVRECDRAEEQHPGDPRTREDSREQLKWTEADEPTADAPSGRERQDPPDLQPRRAEHEQRRRHHLQEHVLEHVGPEKAIGEAVERRLERNQERAEAEVEGLGARAALPAVPAARQPPVPEREDERRRGDRDRRDDVHAAPRGRYRSA